MALYTDGISDQWRQDVQYGEERLALAIARDFDLPLHELADSVFEDIDDFRGSTPLSDDQTIVLLRFRQSETAHIAPVCRDLAN